MPITAYTEDELRRLGLAQLRGLIPEADTSDFGDYDLRARADAAVAAASQAHALALVRQRFVHDCDDSELINHAQSRGLGYLAPTKARGYTVITGAIGDVYAAGETFTGPTGLQYVALADATCASSAFSFATIAEGSGRERLLLSSTVGITTGTILSIGVFYTAVKAVPAAGIVDLLSPIPLIPFVGEVVSSVIGALVPVEALVAGRAANITDKVFLTVDSPIGSIVSVSTATSITGGADTETAPELRQRLIDFEAGRAASTNVEAIRTLARAYPDARIAEAFVYPNFSYPGRVQLVAYGAPRMRELSSLVTADLEAFLNSAIGSEVDLTANAISYDGTPVDLDMTVIPGTGFEPDWGTASAPTLTISVGSTTTRVNTTTDPTARLPVGSRVLVPVVLGSILRTEQRQVVYADASGFDVSEPFSATPTTGGTITSGSPLAQGLIDAAETLFDGLGPGTYVTSATKDRIRWPNPATTGGSIISSSRVIAALSDIEGSLEVAFTSGSFTTRTPAALQTLRLGILTLRWRYP